MSRFCIATLLCCVFWTACAGPTHEERFVLMTLGASDATGAGAVPSSEGYVSVMGRELERRVPGLFLINLGLAGARIDQIMQQARAARQLGMKADLVTIWTGSNDLIHGDHPETFQQRLGMLLRMVRRDLSDRIVVANLPDLTRLPRFRAHPHPAVTAERVAAFNRAILEETAATGASLVDLFSQPVRDELVFNLDGFHPNNAGHREIAGLFLSVILPHTELQGQLTERRLVPGAEANCRQAAWSPSLVCS